MQQATWRWSTSLGSHLFVLALILGLALALSERTTGFTTDEGSYAIQAEALREGSWAIEWPFRSIDPDGDHFPYHGGSVTDDAEYAYVSHPAWPLALATVTRVVPEEVGLRLLPLGAVLAAAALAFHLARKQFGSEASPWAFWLVVASPVLANGLMTWAHAPAAAAAGLAVLSSARVLSEPTRRGTAVLLAALALGVLLRSELLLFAGATAAVVGVTGLQQRSARLVAAAIGCGAAAMTAAAAEHWWIDRILGSGGSPPEIASRAGGSGSWLAGRVTGAGISALQGAMAAPLAAVASILVIVCIAAVVARPGSVRLPPAAVLLWGAAGLIVVRMVAGSDDPVRGLLTAWPVALFAVPGMQRAGSVERRLLAIVGLYTVAVFATQYDDGGGLQWGGRFLAPVIVPLAVLAAAGIQQVRARGENVDVPLKLVLAGLALLSLVVTDGVRSNNADGMATVATQPSDVVIISDRQIARLDWRAWPERCWFYIDPDALMGAVDILARSGVGGATYVLFSQDDLREASLAPRPADDHPQIGSFGETSTCPSGG